MRQLTTEIVPVKIVLVHHDTWNVSIPTEETETPGLESAAECPEWKWTNM